MSCAVLFFFFFFQAEDGIRDKLVTGVQTCALPICWASPRSFASVVLAYLGRVTLRRRVRRVRLLLNIIWLIFGGLWLALGYAVAALIMFVLIITIPFGIAAARLALFSLWPFGRTLVRRRDAGAGALIGNILWFLLAGWWLALGHLVTGVAMCLTIIGIPLGLANFKLIPVALTPFGRDIVDLEQARRLGYEPHVVVRAEPPQRTT